jgi:hypothetical protein
MRFLTNVLCFTYRYVRYATAAYGTSMIDSADLLQVHGMNVVSIESVHDASEKSRTRKVARYLNVKQDNILKITPPGGHIELLGHFVALDHRRNSVTGSPGAVVLSIRSTYTLLGLKIDTEAYSKKVRYAGVAHSGISDRAETLWDHAKEEVLRALRQHSGYDLVITGHSLGAGAAPLLSLKLNYEKSESTASPLKGVNVKCFAFAPPPVYLQTDNTKNVEVAAAMENTYAFIHQNDSVPFLSIDAVCRLVDTVTQVDKLTVWKPVSRPLMAAGFKAIPECIVQVVADGSQNLPPVADGH